MNITLEIKNADIAQKLTRQAMYIYINLRTQLGLNLREKRGGAFKSKSQIQIISDKQCKFGSTNYLKN